MFDENLKFLRLWNQPHTSRVSNSLKSASVWSNSLSLKYKRFTPSGCKDKGVRNYEYAAKTQFLSNGEHNSKWQTDFKMANIF